MLILIMVLSVFGTQVAKAQRYMPFVNDNYSGITGAYLNPASIADSRYLTDITLGGISADFYNNYAYIDRSTLIDALQSGESLRDIRDYLTINNDGKRKFINEELNIQAIGAMVSITPKWSIGFNTGIRQFLTIDNVNEKIIGIFIDDMNNPDYYYDGTSSTQYLMENFAVNVSAYAEYAFSTAGVLWESPNRQHMIKGGLTIKFLQGLAAGYANSTDLILENYAKDSLGIWSNSEKNESAYISYGLSEEFNENYFDNYTFDIKAERLGLGFDFGIIYEWRPDVDNFRKMINCEEQDLRYENKYKLRVGFSVIDLGWVKYKKGQYSQDITVGGRFNTTEYFSNISSITDLNTRLETLAASTDVFNVGANDEGFFRSSLPTALSLQVDYHIIDGLFVNLTPYVALHRNVATDNISKAHSYSIVSLTPRYEKKWFGISVPIQYNQVSDNGFAVGLGLRLGPIWIGTNDMTSICSKQLEDVNLCALVKVPIMYRAKKDSDGDGITNRFDACKYEFGDCANNGCPKKDRDKDGIEDEQDDCPDEAGLAQYNGCPDRDGDGIIDKNDECPDVAGLAQFNGCPDRDGDGVIDKNDECPDVAGLAQFNGCPDTDGDGIQDKFDKCPEEFGTEEFFGCPERDTDKDGVPDHLDDCPTKAGLPEFNGCPDTDGDGVSDNIDECLNTPGPKELNGCPDTDGDGIIDKLDECPNEPGPAERNGCPEKVPVEYASQILFETGKATLKPASSEPLNKLVQLMNDNPECYVTVDGHTDNVGNADFNLKLSQKRAESVKSYLISKGIAPNKVVATGYGLTKPIDTNDTPEGRANNRRTEIDLVTPWVKGQ